MGDPGHVEKAGAMIPEVIMAMIVCLVGSIALAFCASGAVILLGVWLMPPEPSFLRDCQDCRPPVLVPLLVLSEPMADGLHVRVRASDLEFYEHTGRRVPFYRAEVRRGDELVSTWPGFCDTEEQAQAMGEEWICRIRANEELEAAGQQDAAEMVWSL